MNENFFNWRYIFGSLFLVVLVTVAVTLIMNIYLFFPMVTAMNGTITSMSDRNNELSIKVERLVDLAKIKEVQFLEITAFSPRPQETDSTPWIGAANERMAHGQVAVSWDLYTTGWVFYKKVRIECRTVLEIKQGKCGVFTITDLMNKRHRKRIDIFFPSTKKAVKYGLRRRTVALLNPPTDKL